jgi:hypothetical protein
VDPWTVYKHVKFRIQKSHDTGRRSHSGTVPEQAAWAGPPGTCDAHASRIRLTAKAPLSIRATITWSGSTANLPTTRNILSAPNQQSEDFHAQRRPSGQRREIARTFCGTSRRVGRRVGTVGNGRWGGERRRRELRGWLGWLAGLAGWADEWIEGWVPAGTRSVSNSSATASVAKRTHLCV